MIYAESRFRDQTSIAGARGLMQITPATARTTSSGAAAARPSRSRTSPTPTSTFAYGTFYLRELLDTLRAATRWRRWPPTTPGRATPTDWGGADLEVEDIDFPETRAYVEEVLEKRDDYRGKYARELGY